MTTNVEAPRDGPWGELLWGEHFLAREAEVLTAEMTPEEYGVAVQEVINCGGIAEKNSVVMQIYADVTGRPMKVSRSAQTCALGAAIAGAVVAGVKAGGYANVKDAQDAMTGVRQHVYHPNPEAHETYKELFALYSTMHDAMGISGCDRGSGGDTYDVMKKLIDIRTKVRN